MPKTHPCPKCATQVPEGARFCQKCGAPAAPGGTPGNRKTGFQWKLVLGALLAVIAVVAAAMIALSQPGDTAPAAKVAGDSIPGAGPMPDWLTKADPSILADYAWAAEHYEELRYMPCYCGCNSVGHTNNASCYFRWDKDGKIQGYDAHALG